MHHPKRKIESERKRSKKIQKNALNDRASVFNQIENEESLVCALARWVAVCIAIQLSNSSLIPMHQIHCVVWCWERRGARAQLCDVMRIRELPDQQVQYNIYTYVFTVLRDSFAATLLKFSIEMWYDPIRYDTIHNTHKMTYTAVYAVCMARAQRSCGEKSNSARCPNLMA